MKSTNKSVIKRTHVGDIPYEMWMEMARNWDGNACLWADMGRNRNVRAIPPRMESLLKPTSLVIVYLTPSPTDLLRRLLIG